jgi:regulator of extracellular matrix RemA (YlzA/DUF370 family)
MSPPTTNFPWEGIADPNPQHVSLYERYPSPNSSIFDIQQVPQAEGRPKSYSAAALYPNPSQGRPTEEPSHAGYTRMEVAQGVARRLKDEGHTTMRRQKFDELVDQALKTLQTRQGNVLHAEGIPAVDEPQSALSRSASTDESERYTLIDAQQRRDPRAFAVMVLQSPDTVALTSVFDQLKRVFDAFEPYWQADLTHPGPGSTIEGFLQQLDDCKDKWFSTAFQVHAGNKKLLPKAAPSMAGYYFVPNQLHSYDGTRGFMRANSQLRCIPPNAYHRYRPNDRQ